MKFVDALDLLYQGKMIVRDSWLEEEGYLQIIYGVNYVWKILPHNKPHPNAANYMFAVDELKAEDWVEFPKVVKPLDHIEL